MKYYFIIEVEVTGPGWTPEYTESVTEMVKRRGGKYIARTTDIDALEGDIQAENVIIIIEWPSKQAAIDFHQSEEYSLYLNARQASSKGRILLLPGEDNLHADT